MTFNGTSSPISKWRPKRLKVRFQKNHISIRKVLQTGGLSGVTRLQSKQNQNEFRGGVCVNIPMKRYERESKKKTKVVKGTDKERDCLSVQLVAPSVVIEDFWSSGDDMDLAVLEPGGRRVNDENRKSEGGKLIIDNIVDSCEFPDPSGKEILVYRKPCDAFKKGKYREVLTHATNCGKGPTKFDVRVVVDGRRMKKVRGSSDRDGFQAEASFTFKL